MDLVTYACASGVRPCNMPRRTVLPSVGIVQYIIVSRVCIFHKFVRGCRLPELSPCIFNREFTESRRNSDRAKGGRCRRTAKPRLRFHVMAKFRNFRNSSPFRPNSGKLRSGFDKSCLVKTSGFPRRPVVYELAGLKSQFVSQLRSGFDEEMTACRTCQLHEGFSCGLHPFAATCKVPLQTLDRFLDYLRFVLSLNSPNSHLFCFHVFTPQSLVHPCAQFTHLDSKSSTRISNQLTSTQSCTFSDKFVFSPHNPIPHVVLLVLSFHLSPTAA